MKFEADRKALLDAMNFVAKAVATKHPTRPILQNVHIGTGDNKVTLDGTDMEASVSITVDKTEVSEDGAALVPAAKLVEILSKLADEKVALETDGQKLFVKTARSRFKIFGDKPEDFPAMPETDWADALKIPAGLFYEMSNHVTFAAATERTRYALNGVLFAQEKNKLIMVATDGKRLALIKRVLDGCKKTEGVIVPTKAVRMIENLPVVDGEKDIELVLTDKNITAKSSIATVACRLIEGNFPDYEAVLPKGCDKKLTVNADDFKQAIIEGALLADRESSSVKFSFENGKAILASRSPDVGEGRVEAEVEYEGGALDVAFNPVYLLDVLRVMSSKVTIEFKDESSAAMITDGTDYTYIIMPVSIN